MRPLITFLLSFALAAAASSTAWAQAYCALRDPVRQVYEMYPGAKSYRSIVRTVAQKHRSIIADQLPFTMHFTELGRHTVYVALDGAKPIGLVHVRSERGQWGLVEVAWATDLDMHIVDFRFQRCRERAVKLLDTEEFRAQLIGKRVDDLVRMLSGDYRGVNASLLRVPPGAEKLAAVVLRCGAKTLAANEVIWGEDLKGLRRLERGLAAFAGAESVRAVKDPYGSGVLAAIKAALQGASTAIDRSDVVALRVRDGKDSLLGTVVRTTCDFDGRRWTKWWSVDARNTIADISSVGPWPDEETKRAFTALVGASMGETASCANGAMVLATEVLIVAGHQTDRSD